MAKIKEFEEKIGIDFDDKSLIEKAFVHRSFVNESADKKLGHNERIEFLGDAVLELSATDFLFRKFPDETEGVMTAYRSALVNTDSLSVAAKELKMGKYLKLSKGEKSSKKGRGHILANTFESVVGAIYLDKGYGEADKFLKKNLFNYINEIVEHNLHRDPKSYFQEVAQEKVKVTPNYVLVRHEGPDHDRVFVMGLYLGDNFVCEGSGVSKQKAEVDAARKALDLKEWN